MQSVSMTVRPIATAPQLLHNVLKKNARDALQKWREKRERDRESERETDGERERERETDRDKTETDTQRETLKRDVSSSKAFDVFDFPDAIWKIIPNLWDSFFCVERILRSCV